jgi:DNA-binding SARP family transcriptional activator
LRGVKQIALMGFLASNIGISCSREALASIFWRDRFNNQARQSLRQSLSALRRAFQLCPEGLEIERDSVRINPNFVSVDIKQAETAIAAGDLETASNIFRRGEYLATISPKESGITEWLVIERARWRELARQTLLDHGEILLRKTKPSIAAETGEWLLRQDPFDEEATRLTMRSKAAMGSLSEMAKYYHRLCDLLQAELNVNPSVETVDCFNQLKQRDDVAQHALENPSIPDSAFEGALSDVPTISVHTFEFAPVDAATKALSADLRDQLIFRLTKRIGIKVLNEEAGLTNGSTYVLKGRLRTSGNQGRLNLSMVLREQSRTVFSQNYTGDISDSFKFCDELSAQAETQLRVQTNAFDGERLTQIPESKLNVTELRAKAANLLHKGTFESFCHAEILMERAIELNPLDSTSLAMRANIIIWISLAGYRDLTAAEQGKLEADLNTALEGQQGSDYIYHVKGTFNAVCKRDARAALKDGERSLSINPNYALAFNTLGLGHMLLGQYDMAVSMFKKYVELSENDPLLPARLFPLAVAQFCNGEYLDAERTIDHAIGLKPNHRLFHKLRALSLRATGNRDEADAADDTADRLPDIPSMLAVCPPLPQDQSNLFSITMK